MASKIDREAVELNPLSITNSTSTSDEIDFADYASMLVHFPATWTTCNVSVYSQSPVDDTWQPVYASAGALTFAATQDTAFTLDENSFPVKKMKLPWQKKGFLNY